MAAFVARTYRALTGQPCTGFTHPFTDVAGSSFASEDVGCLAELGITTGTTATTFSPGQPVTREETAAFLGRLWRTKAHFPS